MFKTTIHIVRSPGPWTIIIAGWTSYGDFNLNRGSNLALCMSKMLHIFMAVLFTSKVDDQNPTYVFTSRMHTYNFRLWHPTEIAKIFKLNRYVVLLWHVEMGKRSTKCTDFQ